MPNVRYIPDGITRVFSVPTIASAGLVPTAAEITAGTELTAEIATVEGFTFTGGTVETPDWGSTFTSKVPGRDSAEDGVVSWYDYTTTNPLRATLAKGVTTHIVFFSGGTAGAAPAAADKCDVWPVQSTGVSRVRSGGEAVLNRVTLPARKPPVYDVAVT